MSLEPLQVTWYAMGTQWELRMFSTKGRLYLEPIAEAVRDEIEQVEQMLSFYRDDSDLTDLNTRAAAEAVSVDARLFRLLQQCRVLCETTQGAFDPTIAPLLHAWKFVGDTGEMADSDAVEAALSVVGMSNIILDETDFTVRYAREGVLLEFGAIGKGYAIERAVELLREYEIDSALLHGGTSTVYGLGTPPGMEAWNIAIQKPYTPDETLLTVPLVDCALSVSAPHGKGFSRDGKQYGHVLDPRTGYPVQSSSLSAVVTASATESDALSTALLTLGAAGIPVLRAFRPDAWMLVAAEEEGTLMLTEEGTLVRPVAFSSRPDRVSGTYSIKAQ